MNILKKLFNKNNYKKKLTLPVLYYRYMDTIDKYNELTLYLCEHKYILEDMKNKNGYICKASVKKIKEFAKHDGVILFIDDADLYKKEKYLERHNIKYVITDNIKDLQYNTKELDYGI